MNFFVIVFVIISFAMMISCISSPPEFSTVGFLVFFVVMAIWSWESPEDKAAKVQQEELKRQEHEQERAPVKYSEADGCTVYKFKPEDRWLYFTRCADSHTSTENSYEVRSGKTTRVETQVITN